MMGDLGGLLAISEISLPFSQLHSGTCWANLLPLVAGNFNETGGGEGCNVKETQGAKMLLPGPPGRSLGTVPEWHADSITLQGLGWVASHQNFAEGGGVFVREAH